MQVLSIERVVTLLTPLFGAASTFIVTYVATHVPGSPHLDATAVEGIEISAFLGAVGIVAKWLHGRQLPAIAQLGPPPSGAQPVAASPSPHQ